MEKKRKCDLVIDLPFGRCQVEADGPNELSGAVYALYAALGGQCLADGDDMAAKYLLSMYYSERQKSKKNRLSSIAEAGLECDLVKCYLRGFTAAKTVEWLKKERQFNASKSAVGR